MPDFESEMSLMLNIAGIVYIRSCICFLASRILHLLQYTWFNVWPGQLHYALIPCIREHMSSSLITWEKKENRKHWSMEDLHTATKALCLIVRRTCNKSDGKMHLVQFVTRIFDRKCHVWTLIILINWLSCISNEWRKGKGLTDRSQRAR